MATKKKNKYGYQVGGSSSSGGGSGSFGSNPTFKSITGPGGPGGSRAPSTGFSGYAPYQPTQSAYQEGSINAGTPEVSPIGPPSPSVDTQEQRRLARQGFAFDMGDVNRRLMEAAMNYGNLDKVVQYGLDPTGADTSSLANVTANPNSVWANIGRYQKQYDRNINEDLNNRGSFFSGANLTQHRDLSDDVGRQRSQATLDWSSTEAQLLDAILQARAGRDNALRAADLQDIAAAAAMAPVGNPGPAPAAPAPETPYTGLDPFNPMDTIEQPSPMINIPFPSTVGANSLGSLVGNIAHHKRKRR